MNARERLLERGLRVPEALLPARGADPSRFAVIACDQFSAQPEYWDELERFVGTAPSALRLIVPEARLADSEGSAARIAAAMESYLAAGVLCEAGDGFIKVERTTASGTRLGLMAALDLEKYDYRPGAKTPVRATEKTVTERLPARIEVRSLAPLELPHAMVLLDDRGGLLKSAMDDKNAQQLYDFELNMGGGHLRGSLLSADAEEKLADALDELYRQSGDGFVYAVGDGNHSLAAAKEWWERRKTELSPPQRENDPARYCLVEINSLYDPALRFHPIHRLLMNADREDFTARTGIDPLCPPALPELQRALDEYLSKRPDCRLEYIHGERDCRELGEKPGNIAMILPEFDKYTLYDTVRRDGALARKSFSIGEAREKRYYLESRRIK